MRSAISVMIILIFSFFLADLFVSIYDRSKFSSFVNDSKKIQMKACEKDIIILLLCFIVFILL